MTRRLSRDIVHPGETADLTIDLVHSAGASLACAYFAEHLPIGLTLTSLTVKVDNVDVTSRVSSETTSAHAVWANCVTHRIILQSPPATGRGVLVGERCTAIVTLRVDQPGLYSLSRNNWAATIVGQEPLFGWGEEPLHLTCPNASGTVPVTPQVTTELSTVRGEESPSLRQTHAFEEFEGFLPDRIEVDLGSGRFDLEAVAADQRIATVTFNVDYSYPASGQILRAQGAVDIDVLAQTLRGDTLPCRCVVSAASESIVDLLRTRAFLGPLDSPVGRMVGTALIARAVSGGRVALALDGAIFERCPISWDATSVVTLNAGLFFLPQEGRLAVETRYSFEGLASLSSAVSFPITPTVDVAFIRGDLNRDTTIDISDAIALLGYLFNDRQIDCLKSADANDDGQIQISDPIFILTYLFAKGVRPAPPFPACGLDGTSDDLACGWFSTCQ